jgi:hypothetical protein
MRHPPPPETLMLPNEVLRPGPVEVPKTGPVPSALSPPAERQAAIRRAQACVKAATKAGKTGRADKSNGKGRPEAAKDSAEPLAARVWRHAAAMDSKAPWRVVARELGTNPQQTLDAYRIRSLPPAATPEAVSKFLALPTD